MEDYQKGESRAWSIVIKSNYWAVYWLQMRKANSIVDLRTNWYLKQNNKVFFKKKNCAKSKKFLKSMSLSMNIFIWHVLFWIQILEINNILCGRAQVSRGAFALSTNDSLKHS
jgi:hypothetical protein